MVLPFQVEIWFSPALVVQLLGLSLKADKLLFLLFGTIGKKACPCCKSSTALHKCVSVSLSLCSSFFFLLSLCRLGGEDLWLKKALATAGYEVHCFDPSIDAAHLQDSGVWLYQLSIDWREPNPAISAQRQRSSTKKLAAILNDFGHRQLTPNTVDVLKVDMESAEWKILENLVLEGVLHSVGLLLLEVHLHWAGFEVGGDEPNVVRYWFSLLREHERPRLFLQRNLHNTSSTYILGWVNTRYAPQGDRLAWHEFELRGTLFRRAWQLC
uniref:Methyltransferase domain-containing protein n=1 Tax=Electrophorus electricus TaxID=8005 RepID=A0AAY5F3D2_ELEEL